MDRATNLSRFWLRRLHGSGVDGVVWVGLFVWLICLPATTVDLGCCVDSFKHGVAPFDGSGTFIASDDIFWPSSHWHWGAECWRLHRHDDVQLFLLDARFGRGGDRLRRIGRH